MSARSLNKVMLIGNLTRDAELRYTPQGTAVCTFGLATNRQWMPSDGSERQEDVEFHRIVAWAKLAEICAQLLHKGRKVYVEGRLQTRSWTGQDGQERSTTEVVIDSMIALGPPRAGIAEEVTDYKDVASDIGVKAAVATTSASVSDDQSDTKGKRSKTAGKKKAVDEAESEGEDAEEATDRSQKADKDEVKKARESEEGQKDLSEDDIPF